VGLFCILAITSGRSDYQFWMTLEMVSCCVKVSLTCAARVSGLRRGILFVSPWLKVMVED
jgi:hypothetical protein